MRMCEPIQCCTLTFTRAVHRLVPFSSVQDHMRVTGDYILQYLGGLERGIHNPKTRKFSTLLTKQVAAIAVLLGVFDASICIYIACRCSF